MKKLNICPKCGCKLIFRLNGVKLTTNDEAAVAGAAMHPSMAPNPVHNLSVYICAQCAFTEFYTTTPVVEDGNCVTLLTPEAEPPPASVLSAFNFVDDTLASDADFNEPADITAITAIDGSTSPSQMPTAAKVKVVVLEALVEYADALLQAMERIPAARVPPDASALNKALPFVVVEDLAVEEARQIKATLETVGATVDIQPVEGW